MFWRLPFCRYHVTMFAERALGGSLAQLAGEEAGTCGSREPRRLPCVHQRGTSAYDWISHHSTGNTRVVDQDHKWTTDWNVCQLAQGTKQLQPGVSRVIEHLSHLSLLSHGVLFLALLHQYCSVLVCIKGKDSLWCSEAPVTSMWNFIGTHQRDGGFL